MKRKSIWKKALISGLAIMMLTVLCGCDTRSEADIWANVVDSMAYTADDAQRELQELQRDLNRLS